MYADGIIQQILTSALPTATVRTEWTSDYANNLPFIALSGAPTGQISDFRAGGKQFQSVDIDVFSGVDKRNAMSIANQALQAVDEAWRKQTATTDGHVARATVTVLPSVIPTSGLPAGVTRVSCTISINMRP